MSSSVCFLHLNLPLHVVVLVRRLVNVVSTLSITNQCLSGVDHPGEPSKICTAKNGLSRSETSSFTAAAMNGTCACGNRSGTGGEVSSGLTSAGGEIHMGSASGSGSGSSTLQAHCVHLPSNPHGHVNVPPPPGLNLNINFKTLDGRERERERSTWKWMRTSNHYWRWHWHWHRWQWNRGVLVVPPTSAMSFSTQAHPHGQMGTVLSNDASLSTAEPSLTSPEPPHHTHPSNPMPDTKSTRWMLRTLKRLFISSSKYTAHDSDQEAIRLPPPGSDDHPSISRTTRPSHSSVQHTDRELNFYYPNSSSSSSSVSSSSHTEHQHPHEPLQLDLEIHPPIEPAPRSSSPAPFSSSSSSSSSPAPPSHQPSRRPTEEESHIHDRKHPSIDVPPDALHQLLAHPALFDPVRTPRYPIVLCHGLYGFDSRGPSAFPSMRMHYWSNVLNILRGRVGAEVIVTSVPGTGFISTRASALHDQLSVRARGRGINFLAHSMGGLDCRYLISHIRPHEYVPLSLMTIATPHRGSPFMDWCANNIGLGKLRQQEQERERAREMQMQREREREMEEEWESEMMASLGRRTRKDIEDFTADIKAEADANQDADADTQPIAGSEESWSKSNSDSDSHKSKAKPSPSPSSSSSPLSLSSLSSLPSSFTTLLLSIVDSPAYANLTSAYLTQNFNPRTPDDPRVRYWSVAGRMDAAAVGVWHPFWLPKMVLDGVEEREREALRKVWDEERLRKGKGKGKGKGKAEEEEWGEEEEEGTPLWADGRQWGNDGLVTVQSAQWGEFLGIMEGCDHWEIRGARGIELGVDLPAIPAIGLGSFPLASSLGNRHPQPRQAGGDGWGFGDWTKFVSAWKRTSNSGVVGGGTEGKHSVSADPSTSKSTSATEPVAAVNSTPMQASSSSDNTPTTTASTNTATPSPTVTLASDQHLKTEEKAESKAQKRERERLADDQVVKTSTDTLSVVFDWLIERVPVSTQILGGGAVAGHGSGHGSGAPSSSPSHNKERQTANGKPMTDKELSDVAVRHMVGGSTSGPGFSSSSSSSSHPPPMSEMKKRMDKEDKGRNRKRELARKEDLERFYVALARKMYDEGL